MKKILSLAVALAMVAMLAACGGDQVTVDSLNGEWVIDVDASLAAMGQEDESAAMLVKGMLKDMAIKIDTKAKTITVSAAGHSDSKPFEVESQKDNSFVLKAGGDSVEATLVKKGDKDTLTLSQDGKGKKLVLVRK